MNYTSHFSKETSHAEFERIVDNSHDTWDDTIAFTPFYDPYKKLIIKRPVPCILPRDTPYRRTIHFHQANRTRQSGVSLRLNAPLLNETEPVLRASGYTIRIDWPGYESNHRVSSYLPKMRNITRRDMLDLVRDAYFQFFNSKFGQPLGTRFQRKNADWYLGAGTIPHYDLSLIALHEIEDDVWIANMVHEIFDESPPTILPVPSTSMTEMSGVRGLSPEPSKPKLVVERRTPSRTDSERTNNDWLESNDYPTPDICRSYEDSAPPTKRRKRLSDRT